MNVKILGSGCPKCKNLEKKILDIKKKNHLDFELEKLTQIDDIMKYGIMMTPGLVINEELKSVGGIPKENELLGWLQNE